MTKITSVGFLRQLAESFGGIRTVRGQGLHRAAANMIKMHEELERISAVSARLLIKSADGMSWEEIVELSAQGIYKVAREETLRTNPILQPPEWLHLPAEHRERFRKMAMASLGQTTHEPPATEEEAAA